MDTQDAVEKWMNSLGFDQNAVGGYFKKGYFVGGNEATFFYQQIFKTAVDQADTDAKFIKAQLCSQKIELVRARIDELETVGRNDLLAMNYDTAQIFHQRIKELKAKLAKLEGKIE